MIIVIALSIKNNYILRIHAKQNINILFKKQKKKKKRENGIENLNDSKAFIEYTNNI